MGLVLPNRAVNTILVCIHLHLHFHFLITFCTKSLLFTALNAENDRLCEEVRIKSHNPPVVPTVNPNENTQVRMYYMNYSHVLTFMCISVWERLMSVGSYVLFLCYASVMTSCRTWLTIFCLLASMVSTYVCSNILMQ